MLGFIVSALIGGLLIYIGLLNVKGNVSMLHSYHIKRVKEEDILPFGKAIGTGMFIIGGGIIAYSAVAIISDIIKSEILFIAANVGLVVAMVVSVIVIFRALFKYNKGIF